MHDKTITIDGATVQHGENNSRVYLMDIKDAHPDTLVDSLASLAHENGYGKIFAKVPKSKADAFMKAGYAVEASAYGLYGGSERGLFLSKYLKVEREHEESLYTYQDVLSLAYGKEEPELPPLEEGESVRLCTTSDIVKMAELYKGVFDSYPFPIDKPSFLASAMQGQTIFAGVEKGGVIVALASAECDLSEGHQYAEMTDFATDGEHRGNGYALHLLRFLETQAKGQGVRTAFTIARAISEGMNITFSKAGYTYGGRLKNNTDISGTIESMNVWYKGL
ncbi:MAG: putative beta-lysine N-acetyltransferase [Sphaerochaeta sp.]|nr:putative beta-lysine N-acetyltransferase [Sphaerochaeta sp.]